MNLKKYNSGTSLKLDIDEKIKYMCLDGNEFPYNPSPKVIGRILEITNNGLINKYPDITNKKLIKKISEYAEVPEEYIVMTNGADSAIRYICNAFIGESKFFFIKQEKITYQFFSSYAKSLGYFISFAAKDIFSTSLNSFFDGRERLSYIVNPANPSGIMYSRNDILELVNKNRNKYFLIDEAYTEFGSEDVAKHVPNFKNLIVVRTFSKAFGLAGMRVGYMVIDPEFSKTKILPYKDNKEISLLSQVAAITALEDLEYMHDKVKIMEEDRNRMVSSLCSLGIRAINTNSNFFLIKDLRVMNLKKYLTKQKILVRIYDSWENYMRISIGTTEVMDILLEEIKKYIGGN